MPIFKNIIASKSLQTLSPQSGPSSIYKSLTVLEGREGLSPEAACLQYLEERSYLEMAVEC